MRNCFADQRQSAGGRRLHTSADPGKGAMKKTRRLHKNKEAKANFLSTPSHLLNTKMAKFHSKSPRPNRELCSWLSSKWPHRSGMSCRCSIHRTGPEYQKMPVKRAGREASTEISHTCEALKWIFLENGWMNIRSYFRAKTCQDVTNN